MCGETLTIAIYDIDFDDIHHLTKIIEQQLQIKLKVKL